MTTIIGSLVYEITAHTAGLDAALAESEAKSEGFGKKLAGHAIAAGAAITALGAVAAGISLDMAKNFEHATTLLVTGAGESQDAIGGVRSGLLDMSVEVGRSAKELAEGMFMVESAGYHGAAGLAVMKAAAEGAVVGNATLETTANAVTTVMKDYGIGAEHAADATNFLVGVVSLGKTHMEDLAGSMATILPFASSLHIPLEQVGGAMATMTSHGISADKAATYLRFTLSSLVNPSQAAVDALGNIGLKSTDLAHMLTEKGLLPTMQALQDAIGKKFPAGSAEAVAALAEITGGARGLQAGLQLTGMGMAEFIKSTDTVAKKITDAHGEIIGWSTAQDDLSFQIDRAQALLGKYAIQFGDFLMPVVKDAITAFTTDLPVAISIVQGWFEANSTTIQNVATVAWTGFVDALQAAWQVLNGAIFPALGVMVDWFLIHVWPALVKVSQFIITDVVPAIGKIAVWARDVLLPPLGRLVDVFREDILPALMRFANAIIQNVLPYVLGLGKTLIDWVIKPLTEVARVVIPPLIDAFTFLARNITLFGPVLLAIGGYWAFVELKSLAAAAAMAVAAAVGPLIEGLGLTVFALQAFFGGAATAAEAFALIMSTSFAPVLIVAGVAALVVGLTHLSDIFPDANKQLQDARDNIKKMNEAADKNVVDDLAQSTNAFTTALEANARAFDNINIDKEFAELKKTSDQAKDMSDKLSNVSTTSFEGFKEQMQNLTIPSDIQEHWDTFDATTRGVFNELISQKDFSAIRDFDKAIQDSNGNSFQAIQKLGEKHHDVSQAMIRDLENYYDEASKSSESAYLRQFDAAQSMFNSLKDAYHGDAAAAMAEMQAKHPDQAAQMQYLEDLANKTGLTTDRIIDLNRQGVDSLGPVNIALDHAGVATGTWNDHLAALTGTGLQGAIPQLQALHESSAATASYMDHLSQTQLNDLARTLQTAGANMPVDQALALYQSMHWLSQLNLGPLLGQIQNVAKNIPVVSAFANLIPHAVGGKFETPHIALIAEGGEPEWVIPQSKAMGMDALLDSMVGIASSPLPSMPAMTTNGMPQVQVKPATQVSVELNLNGVMAKSRSDVRAIGMDMLDAVNEGLIAKGLDPLPTRRVTLT